MERYVSHRSETGAPVINVVETYNKIKLAARVIAGVTRLSDVLCVSSRPTGQRAVIKFATYTGAHATSDARWVPGILTNQETAHFKEPRLVVVVDTYADRKAVVEASYMNIPVIALANLDSNLQFVDVAIPCNNKSTESISMIFWLLAREVRILRGEAGRNDPWTVPVDLFYHKQIDHVVPGEEKIQETKDTAQVAEGDDDNDDGQKWDQDD